MTAKLECPDFMGSIDKHEPERVQEELLLHLQDAVRLPLEETLPRDFTSCDLHVQKCFDRADMFDKCCRISAQCISGFTYEFMWTRTCYLQQKAH